ncbi:MAG: UDP-N-acetylmuramoyl-L-alanine--D-glutamate ligase [Rikenella sp.]|nr:UDP-N-acetylmuramoyl-L-alanine--D-glutamate ligase [Rikenella sp.]
MALAVILGGGESGYGSAVLAAAKGYDVLLSDSGALKEPYRGRLLERGIAFEEGGHTLERILGAEFVVKSPGIPETAPVVRSVREKGIPVISEIEFAGRYLAPQTRTVCITGSNGKTTTTTLIHEMMRAAGFRAELAGNIGRSLALQVAETEAAAQPDWYVIELSSFQLDGMFAFRADVALLLNITPDHLDRYDHRMENYVASKFRIVQNQRPEDLFVYSGEDPETQAFLPQVLPGLSAARTAFYVKNTPPQAGGGDEATAWYDAATGLMHCGGFEFPVAEMRIKGLHNIANALAAVAACRRAGVPDSVIAATLRSFGGVEHRLEPVATIGGVEYINDSKATNVDSVWYALQAMTRPTVWIAGGTDKGNDYEVLLPLVREHVKALVCLGLDNAKLVRSFTGVVPVYDTSSLEAALAAAREAAQPGDTVLLSPACASFDLFRNYEDRGTRFKQAVRNLLP